MKTSDIETTTIERYFNIQRWPLLQNKSINCQVGKQKLCTKTVYIGQMWENRFAFSFQTVFLPLRLVLSLPPPWLPSPPSLSLPLPRSRRLSWWSSFSLLFFTPPPLYRFWKLQVGGSSIHPFQRLEQATTPISREAHRWGSINPTVIQACQKYARESPFVWGENIFLF